MPQDEIERAKQLAKHNPRSQWTGPQGVKKEAEKRATSELRKPSYTKETLGSKLKNRGK